MMRFGAQWTGGNFRCNEDDIWQGRSKISFKMAVNVEFSAQRGDKCSFWTLKVKQSELCCGPVWRQKQAWVQGWQDGRCVSARGWALAQKCQGLKLTRMPAFAFKMKARTQDAWSFKALEKDSMQTKQRFKFSPSGGAATLLRSDQMAGKIQMLWQKGSQKFVANFTRKI